MNTPIICKFNEWQTILLGLKILVRTFESIKVNPCSAKPTSLVSSIIKGMGFFGSFTLFLRLLVAYNQGDRDTTLHLWLLIQYSQGDWVIFGRV